MAGVLEVPLEIHVFIDARGEDAFLGHSGNAAIGITRGATLARKQDRVRRSYERFHRMHQLA